MTAMSVAEHGTEIGITVSVVRAGALYVRPTSTDLRTREIPMRLDRERGNVRRLSTGAFAAVLAQLLMLTLATCSRSARAQSAIAIDPFTGSGALSGWTSAINGWARNSDKAEPSTNAGGAGAFNLAYDSAVSFSVVSDQYAKATITGHTPGNQPSVVVRWTTGTGGYGCGPLFATNGTGIVKLDGSASNSNVATETSTVWADGDTVELQASGSSPAVLTCLRNNAAITGLPPYTDSTSPLSGGQPGIWTFTTDGLERLDNFEAGILQVSGYSYTTLTSIASTSWCIDVNTVASPAIATGDIVKMTTATSPGSFAVSQSADCNLSYPGDSSRQSLLYSIFDVSAGAWMSPDPAALWFNNQAPTFPPGPLPLVYRTGVAITSLDLCALASDAENDTLTGAWTSGTLPTGLSQGGTNNCTLSGTPTIENESGAPMTFTVTDIAGATASLAVTIYPVTTVTMPDCVSMPTDSTSCAALMAAKWLTVTQAQSCNRLKPANRVLTQSATAGSEVAPFSAVTLGVARSCPFMGLGR